MDIADSVNVKTNWHNYFKKTAKWHYRYQETNYNGTAGIYFMKTKNTNFVVFSRLQFWVLLHKAYNILVKSTAPIFLVEDPDMTSKVCKINISVIFNVQKSGSCEMCTYDHFPYKISQA
jgi:hypothetical protein